MLPTGPAALTHRRRALLLLLLTLLLLWSVWATAILPQLEPLTGAAQTLRSIGVRVLLWIVPCAIYARAVGLRMTWWPWYFNLPPSPRHALLSALTILAAGLAVSIDVARKLSVTPWHVWQLLLQRPFAAPIPEFFEELVFRGIVLNELLAVLPARPQAEAERAEVLSERARFWLANFTCSLVFTGLHWPWWIYTGGFTQEFWLKSGGVCLISLVLGVLFVRSRSLWPCVALHWLNNALSSLGGSA